MTLPKMMSYYHTDLHLSLRVPEDWSGQEVSPSEFRIISSPAPTSDSYRSTLSYQLGRPEGEGDEWLDAVFAQSGEEMRATYPAFQLIKEERFLLSSLAPVFLRHYHWQDDETGLAFAQLLALIMPNNTALYLINAATLLALEAQYLPIQIAIIRSTRIISSRSDICIGSRTPIA